MFKKATIKSNVTLTIENVRLHNSQTHDSIFFPFVAFYFLYKTWKLDHFPHGYTGKSLISV